MKEWTTIGRALALCLAISGGVAAGQDEAPATPTQADAKAELPSAESLFQKHIEAIGGKEKIFEIKSRRMTGSLKLFLAGEDTPRQTMILRIMGKAPDLFMQEVVVPGQATTVQVFDGKAAWVVDQNGEASALEGEALDRMMMNSQFYAEADYEKRFKSMETVEQQEVEGDTIAIVKVEYHSGRSEAYLFNETSGLLVGVIGARSIQGQTVQFRRSYEDYKDFGSGVMNPSVVREVIGNQMYELTFSKVETGVDFPEVKRPEGIEDADLSAYQAG